MSVPKSCIYELWDAFNDIAEGYGLTFPEFRDILKVALIEHLGVSEQVLTLDAEKVFRTFDDDQVRMARCHGCCGFLFTSIEVDGHAVPGIPAIVRTIW